MVTGKSEGKLNVSVVGKLLLGADCLRERLWRFVVLEQCSYSFKNSQLCGLPASNRKARRIASMARVG